jgi:Fe-S cluster assembly protein SufD
LDTAAEAYAAFCYQHRVDVLTVDGTPTAPLTIEHGARSGPMVLRLLANARLDLREIFTSDSDQQLHNLWVELGPGSQLLHSRNSFSRTTHWQFLHVVLAKDAHYQLHNHSTGARMRRQDIQVVCAAAGAHADITSAARVAEGSHYDQQITVEHTAANTVSQQSVRTIAEDRAKVTFNGRIHIHPQCNGADAQLSNRNLITGKNATVNTKPELEIYTDDVKCAHGATIGQLDADHLFYFASRGIDEAQARELLGQAFLNSCIAGPLESEARAVLQAADHA